MSEKEPPFIPPYFVEQNKARKAAAEIYVALQPNAALVQATADLLAARTALYKQQPGSSLVQIVDVTLGDLLKAQQL